MKHNNTNDNLWCVYMHVSQSKRVYVGIAKGNPEHRWGQDGIKYKNKHEDGSYVQPAMAYALDKYPDWNNEWEHKIMYQNLSHQDACQKEMELIDLYHSNVCKWGREANGYNMTDGGGGSIGRTLSDVTLAKMSTSQKERFATPRSNPFYGKQHTKESKVKMKEAASKRWTEKERMKYSENKRLYYSSGNTKEKATITKQKISEHHADVSGQNNPQYGSGRRVVQLTLDDDLIQEYVSAWDASKRTGFNASNIYKCCNKQPKYKTAYGFKWMYKDEWHKLPNNGEYEQ